MYLINPSFSTIKNTEFNSKPCMLKRGYVNLMPLKNDVFFKGYNKTYNMDKARTVKDIPKDANILICSAKTKVKFPEGFEANEIIQTANGMSWYKRNIIGEDANNISLKKSKIGYIHGFGTPICGSLNLNNSKVDQVENVTKVELKNNSRIDYLDKVDSLSADDSYLGSVNITGCAKLKDSSVDKIVGATNVIAAPGVKINELHSKLLNCESDESLDSNMYTELGDVTAEEAASLDQVKAKGTVKTKSLAMKDSFANNLTADYCMDFKNSVVNNLTLYNVKRLDGCKAKVFNIASIDPSVLFNNRTQIDELNLPYGSAKLFVNNERQWDKTLNNYIKKINVHGKDNPVVKIQGGIEVQEINFLDSPGTVEFTKKEQYCPRAKINNGTAKYGVPTEIPDTDNNYDDD